MEPPAARRARPREAQAAGDAEDRLSALGDDTLHAILARLPLRDAAATAALSRRWPRVFATLPRLLLRPATFNRRGFPDDGGDGDYEGRCEDAGRWMDALARVLRGRAAPLVTLDVEAAFLDQHGARFHRLLRDLCAGAGGRGLLELSLGNTRHAECPALPTPVYGCAALTSLDLYNWRLQTPSKLTGLRAVRLLRLRNVAATDAVLRRVIARCGALERLEIHDVHTARNLVVCAPRLESLDVYSYRPLRVAVRKAPPLDTVRLSLSYGYPEDHWSLHDRIDVDGEQSLPETTEEMLDFKKMAETEHKQTDEVGNMVSFLGGLGRTKNLRLHLSTEYSEVLSMAKVSIPKRLHEKNLLLGLKTLALTLDHNHEVLATFVSCLLNSSPNLKDLRITELRRSGNPVPLSAEFWDKQINAGCVLNLSTVTLYTDSLFEGQPCWGLCRVLVMKAKVLERMTIQYHSQVNPEHEAKIKAMQRGFPLWPRASLDVVLEMCPLDGCPCF
ncbi:hypothetical protein ACP4OV_003216 [Aristida adscensionis]